MFLIKQSTIGPDPFWNPKEYKIFIKDPKKYLHNLKTTKLKRSEKKK